MTRYSLWTADSYFHFLCKHVNISGPGGPSPGIADSRGTELSQGDWTWIRNSVFMRWDNSDNKDTASVTLILFSFSSQLRNRCQRLWETDMSRVLVDPFSLFVICFDELWLQAQQIVDKVAGVFGTMERVSRFMNQVRVFRSLMLNCRLRWTSLSPQRTETIMASTTLLASTISRSM